MTYRLSLWWNLFKVRLKLSSILLGHLFIADPWVIIATTELPLCYGLLWMLTRAHYGELTCVYFSLVALRFARLVLASDDSAKLDRPLLDSLRAHPRLAALVKVIRADFGLQAFESVKFPLSPVAWRPFGCSANQLRMDKSSIVIPIGCLGIFSIFDLKCELAHAQTRCRSRLIVPACERSGRDLKRFASGSVLRSRSPLELWAISKIAAAYKITLTRWNLLADMQADQKVASKYGAFAVTSWMQRSELAKFSVWKSVRGRIVPLAEEGILFSVSDSCRAFHTLFEGLWLDALRKRMVKSERNPKTLTPILIRLGALQQGLQNAGGVDPRSAATLFDKLESLEESVIRNEIHAASGITFRRPEAGQFAEAVLIPLMEKELARNANLVRHWTLCDLPGLIARKKEIAAAYLPDGRFLLADDQREAMMPALFASFMTIQLVAIGWLPSHSEQEGLVLSHGGKRICPNFTVNALLSGELSREAFLGLIEREGGA